MRKPLRLAPLAVLVASALVAACSSSSGGGSGNAPDGGGSSDDASGAADGAGAADGGGTPDGGDATIDAPGGDSGSGVDTGASDGQGSPSDASEAGAGDSAVEAGASDAAPDAAPDAGPDATADAPHDAAPDGTAEAGPCVDSDGDGYFAGSGCTAPVDCDDTNPFVNPGMLELADDGIDNDCSGSALTAAAGPGVYVDVANASCSDTDSARGTKTEPYCAIAKAVADAQSASTPRNVFVAKGSYPVAFVTGASATTNLFGGYDSAAWTYDPAANVTTIGGQDTVQYAGGTGATAWVTWQGTGVLQGFHASGGAFAADAGVGNFFTVDVSTGARATLAYDSLTGGSAKGSITVEIRTSASAFLFENTITGGTSTTSGAYGVNALGPATLFGNRIDCSNGTAVQNFSTMVLVANVLNGSAGASNVGQTSGLNNFAATGTATAMVVGNVIFGGRGLSASYGVQSYGDITLIDNVLGGHGPVASAGATSDNVAFFSYSTGTSKLVNNDFYTPLTSGTANAVYASVGDAGAFQYYASPPTIDSCGFNGCLLAQGTLVADPSFSGPSAGDFHILGVSPCRGAGADPSQWTHAGIARRDMDLEARPQGSWDIGADEIP